VEEAVKNAIIHGNKKDPRKFVKIVFERRPIGLLFRIEDEGPGFIVSDIPNPLETDSETGNGIFLMRSLADRVKFNSAGNGVEILFSISSINQETTLRRITQMNNYFQKHKTVAK
jgi:serine/threonine-protein kinase RsbW